MTEFQNPIIPGYSPDPSICRVGDDFYLVNSTFEFFPGVPVYHSKNLVNWTLIGHCLTRESQLYLTGCRNSGGIYAPTIRYHDGTFFMITTNVTHNGNFVVHTQDICGEWSEPYLIDQNGIDPSLMWDDDGTCYYCSTGHLDGVRGIISFAIDPFQGKILSEKHLISTGCGGQCAEGPHIYKKDGYYYLLLAEGGTEYGHRATLQRSKHIFGPYVPCPHNPILTHMEDKANEIQATGHADFVEDQHGNWWLVCLGIRRFSHALLHNLGRETFLSPVRWEKNEWPVVGNQGKITLRMQAALPAPAEPVDHSVCIDLYNEPLSERLFYTRNPDRRHYCHNSKDGTLTLTGTGVSINEPGASPTIMSIRQPGFCTTVTTYIDLSSVCAKRFGIAAYYNNDYHYDLYVSGSEGKYHLGFYKHVHDFGAEVNKISLPSSGILELCIRTDREGYHFYGRTEGQEDYTQLGFGHNAGLSTEGTKIMTFTGTLFSLFCEQGTGTFVRSFSIQMNPDVDYTL